MDLTSSPGDYDIWPSMDQTKVAYPEKKGKKNAPEGAIKDPLLCRMLLCSPPLKAKWVLSYELLPSDLRPDSHS